MVRGTKAAAQTAKQEDVSRMNVIEKLNSYTQWAAAICVAIAIYLSAVLLGVSIQRHRQYGGGFHDHAYGRWHTQSWVVDFQERTCKVCGWAQRAKIDIADSKAEQPK